MEASDITLKDALTYLVKFNPIKIIFNNCIVYNDYDSDIEIEPEVYGENELPEKVLPKRIWQFDHYIITNIKIQIVQFHHSIIYLTGYYKAKGDGFSGAN